MKAKFLVVLWSVFFAFLFSEISLGASYQCKFLGVGAVIGRGIGRDRARLGIVRRRAVIKCPTNYVAVEGNNLFEAKNYFLRTKCDLFTFITPTDRELVICRESLSGRGEEYIGDLRLFGGRERKPSLGEIKDRYRNRKSYDKILYIFRHYVPVTPEASKTYHRNINRYRDR